jgi:hypothetical protein
VRANPAAATRRTTSAVLIYLIILLSLQVFVITVAVEAFATGDRSLAWASAAISVVLAAGSAVTIRFLRH